MKRLTDKRLAIPPGQWQEVTHEQRMELQEIPVPSMRELYYRLFQIEDILCDSVGDDDPDAEDDYDLDRLAVMCNQRMTMREEVSERFSLTAKIPLDRLRELAEADREGRCVVLPRLEPGQDDPGLPGVPGPPGNVVFCKDCGHLEYSDCYGECGRGYLGIVKPYDYCSRGMRRDKENDT